MKIINKEVNSCRDCYFPRNVYLIKEGVTFCEHPSKIIRGSLDNLDIIHPDCPLEDAEKKPDLTLIDGAV
jgi:hypothetical protein